MKKQFFNKIQNIAVTLDNEQFIKLGAALDIYCLSGTKVRSIDSLDVAMLDIMNAKYKEVAGAFLIGITGGGDQTFAGGDDSYMTAAIGLPFSLYDATTYAFAGFYTLDASDAITHIASDDSVVNGRLYVAQVMSDVPIALADSAVTAQALLKIITSRGVDKFVTAAEVSDTTTGKFTLTVTIESNQYTYDIVSFKLAVIQGKMWKRLQFPFHTTFDGTEYPMGTEIELEYDIDEETKYALFFFKDEYGNVSFPLIYAINP